MEGCSNGETDSGLLAPLIGEKATITNFTNSNLDNVDDVDERKRILSAAAAAAAAAAAIPNRMEGWVLNPKTTTTTWTASLSDDENNNETTTTTTQRRESAIASIRKNWWALQDAPDDIKNDKRLMLDVVTRDWRVLKYASTSLKADKEIVFKAVQANSKAILWSSDKLKNDKEIIIECVKQDGNCLRFASTTLRSNKDVVLVAISNKPEALKFALDGLNQDRDCLIAAGLWDTSYNRINVLQQNHLQTKNKDPNRDNDISTRDSVLSTSSLPPNAVKVVLSTRFSLDEDSTPTATQFTVLLKEHSYFSRRHHGELIPEQDTRNDFHDDDDEIDDGFGDVTTTNDDDDTFFVIYSPNAFNKGTCDPEWTRLEWPCRGTYETCRKESHLKSGLPQPKQCCWRYSFRYHLQEAKEQTNQGFMIQIVELRQIGGTMSYDYKYQLGKGQQIEREMANDVHIKIFAVYQSMHGQYRHRLEFCSKEIDELVREIKLWYANGCKDMTLCHVGRNPNLVKK